MAAPLSDFKLVTTMVDPETHKVLTDLAATEQVTLAYLVANILKTFVDAGVNRLLADVVGGDSK
jgi:hypothetical protein